jgi:hypothetical protein
MLGGPLVVGLAVMIASPSGGLQSPADLLISKQEALFWAIKQAKRGLACLLACLLVYCLYIVNLVVAVVGNRPLVF